MKKALISDVSYVILFPKDKSYSGSLNQLNRNLMNDPSYNALNYFDVNRDLLRIYQDLGVSLYIFTSDVIQDRPEFAEDLEIFKKIFSASKMHTNKTETVSYKQIIRNIELNPEEVVYVDDNEENVLAAKKAGLDTILYKNNEQVSNILNERFRS